jgi:hypothetical protein
MTQYRSENAKCVSAMDSRHVLEGAWKGNIQARRAIYVNIHGFWMSPSNQYRRLAGLRKLRYRQNSFCDSSNTLCLTLRILIYLRLWPEENIYSTYPSPSSWGVFRLLVLLGLSLQERTSWAPKYTPMLPPRVHQVGRSMRCASYVGAKDT